MLPLAYRGVGKFVAPLMLALLASCATPATFQGMVADRYDVARQHPVSVSVRTSGGSETSATGKTQISNNEFAKALTESISKSRVFSRVVPSGGDYLLQVVIVSLEQPTFGGTFTVKMEAGWTLKRSDGTVVWQEAIRSIHAVSVEEELVGVTRLRVATEGAARENIKKGLAKISRLNL
ncbi:MAG: hypothetical protein AMJ84_04945 [Acidithiobacillales bacterium SM23_46]|nr:MAG: hypothetical protein AMJ84_04945 [Acidithiobacillales bacterium SM23_46]KPL26558.1 MAG: hypothetical protein AMJ72_12460 [Acidithiobacillales bacterium SM1_46]